jgi:hypothetical protein
MKILFLVTTLFSLSAAADEAMLPLPGTFNAEGANYWVKIFPESLTITVPGLPFLEKQVNILRFLVASKEYTAALKTFTYKGFVGASITPGTKESPNLWKIEFAFTDSQLGIRGPQDTPFYLYATVKETALDVFAAPTFSEVVKPEAAVKPPVNTTQPVPSPVQPGELKPVPPVPKPN